MDQTKTALVLGATGGVGGEVAAELHRQGYRVVALTRHKTPLNPDYEWIHGDAMNRDDVIRAATGVEVIVHGVNPPGYKNWDQLVLPMLENTIAAAKQSRSRILFPGTLYNFGADTAQPLREMTPQRPTSRKGVIRVQMEEKLAEAAAQGVKVLIVRAGDYFGPKGSSWFSQGMITPNKPVKSILHPGRAKTGHAWAYLPDLAKTMVQLLAQPLEDFAVYHFAGHWDADGMAMTAAIREATGQPKLPVRRLPWIAVRALSPFVRLCAEMAEIRYLWLNAFELSNEKLVAKLGSEPRTPLNEAVKATLKASGCL